jgi:hypothetical protein
MSERDNLIAEQVFLTERLAQLPSAARLMRRSAEARLQQVSELLAQMPAVVIPRASVKLTFRGRPVLGSEGILADFGMKAVSAFSDAVAAVAASLSAPLAAMGPIPNRDANQLLITGTAVGSFGFELQELPPQQANLLEPSAVGRALAHTQDLLLGTMAPDDELLADTAAELDQRAIDKVRSFIAVLRDYEATCALQFGNRAFRFNELAQVQASLDRLSRDNLHEVSVVVEGHFEGLLPRRKSFEFRRADTGEVLTGKVAASITNPEIVNAHLNEQVSVQLTETVVGRGRPRYVLAALPAAWGSNVPEQSQA